MKQQLKGRELKTLSRAFVLALDERAYLASGKPEVS